MDPVLSVPMTVRRRAVLPAGAADAGAAGAAGAAEVAEAGAGAAPRLPPAF
ncbi:hypothetical protein RGF97_21360 [Streptomyces roseicoloratus]|uniref:Uncharacterized protein n=1 Tax=Streptomyces roseicoloratus TaxID=2508722 RepID=A0ABY9RZA7_9ACTN|nr:hypothetical protein [Streptomyces roseicoloratus]WMX46861.1 hypothetical protein RGF97_21360 [Streptomyces roseicoloratus]